MSYDILVFYMIAQKNMADANQMEYLMESSEDNSNTLLIKSTTTDDFEKFNLNSSLKSGVDLDEKSHKKG